MRQTLVAGLLVTGLVTSTGGGSAASATFATESHECAFYGFAQTVFACSIAQQGTARADASDCIADGCVVRVQAALDGEVQVPGLLGITGEVLFRDARDLICNVVTTLPDDGLACSGDAVLFVPVAPGACEDFVVAARMVEVLLSVVVSANPQFRADTERTFHLCRDAAGEPSLA